MTRAQRTALITGASGGLGVAIASAFARNGFKLILHARNKPATPCVDGVWVLGDLREQGTLDRLHAAIEEHQPDVIVNNAAVQGPIGPAWELDQAQVKQAIEVDLLVPMQLCAYVIPGMIKRGYGKIINISGGGATNTRPFFTPYAIAKTALVRYSECLAGELQGTGIDVNCIAPGAMKTAMTQKIVDAGAKAGTKELEGAKKLKDGGDVIQNAAALCAYLASPVSDGVSGKLISAVWDDWRHFTQTSDHFADKENYTLRRIVPKEKEG